MGLFGGIKNFVAWNKLGLQLSHIQSAFADWQKKDPVNFKANLLNVGKHLALSAASILGAALLHAGIDWLGSPAVTGILTNDLPSYVTLPLIPIIHAAQVALINHFKTV